MSPVHFGPVSGALGCNVSGSRRTSICKVNLSPVEIAPHPVKLRTYVPLKSGALNVSWVDREYLCQWNSDQVPWVCPNMDPHGNILDAGGFYGVGLD